METVEILDWVNKTRGIQNRLRVLQPRFVALLTTVMEEVVLKDPPMCSPPMPTSLEPLRPL